ncbi:MAG TPA: glycosyltransferase family 4 protein [Spirochaetota bacterium]|nr:glycosyltransferase family 4 protein [Spirochaetota bacterium]HNT09868.1 glycosyltransferase family 4 protein [Spirochaetota bacterium]
MPRNVHNKKTVLMVNGHYPPAKCGMGDYTKRLADEVRATGAYDVDVLTAAYPGIAKIRTERGVRVLRIPRRWDAAEYGKLREHLRGRYDVLHIQYHDGDYPSLELLRRLPRLMKDDGRVGSVMISMAGFKDSDRSLEKLFAESDLVNVTTDEDGARIRRITGISESKLRTIYDGPNMLPMNERYIHTPRTQVGAKKKPARLLHFGFLSPQKGFEEIVEALRIVTDSGVEVRLDVIGSDHEARETDYFKRIKTLIKKKGMGERITFHGFIGGAKMNRIFSQADLAIFPFRDGISGKRSSLWSVMSFGVPCISTESAMVPVGIRHGENILLTPAREPRVLASAVIAAVSDDALRARLSHGALEVVRRQYSWERIRTEVVDAYEAMLHGRI